MSAETMNTETMNPETMNPETNTAVAPTMVATFATTPKRGQARKMPKEPHTLLAYAIETGGRIELTPEVKQELMSRGLPEHRIPNAAYGIRKFFGKTVATERKGRAVSAYTITL